MCCSIGSESDLCGFIEHVLDSVLCNIFLFACNCRMVASIILGQAKRAMQSLRTDLTHFKGGASDAAFLAPPL